VRPATAGQPQWANPILDELQFLGKRDLALMAAAMHGISQQNAPVLFPVRGCRSSR
jgi:hypothetical protein